MGPRRWSRGRDRSRDSEPSGGSCFNGATAMEPWKSGGPLVIWIIRQQLQWGHGDGAVEECTTVKSWFCQLTASMGPRRWSRGRGRRRPATARLLSASMGPRRWSRGRGLLRRLDSRPTNWLQWGHGDGAVEESLVAMVRWIDYWSFNGATAMEPWKSATTA